MKNLIVLLASIIFLSGCSGHDKAQATALKINNYEISQAEFEQEFKDSSFSALDTPQSRKDFLANLVDRILILQDAQREGLDKDPKFLKIVEKFWAQSLLRLAIEKKSKEFRDVSSASGKESSLMDEWLNQLRMKADIKINNDLIGGK